MNPATGLRILSRTGTIKAIGAVLCNLVPTDTLQLAAMQHATCNPLSRRLPFETFDTDIRPTTPRSAPDREVGGQQVGPNWSTRASQDKERKEGKTISQVARPSEICNSVGMFFGMVGSVPPVRSRHAPAPPSINLVHACLRNQKRHIPCPFPRLCSTDFLVSRIVGERCPGYHPSFSLILPSRIGLVPCSSAIRHSEGLPHSAYESAVSSFGGVDQKAAFCIVGRQFRAGKSCSIKKKFLALVFFRILACADS